MKLRKPENRYGRRTGRRVRRDVKSDRVPGRCNETRKEKEGGKMNSTAVLVEGEKRN